MRILLVNNDSDTWSKLVTVVEATGYEVEPIHHSAIGAIDARAYDVAILSGGWWADYQEIPEVLEMYAEELQFIRSNPIPILGICVGMQLQHVALNQAVPLMDEPQSGDKPITVSERGQELFGFPPELEVFKNHTRAIFETDPQFEILATSSTTPKFTEMMIHKEKPLLGVQFHPEMGPVDLAADRVKALVSGLLKTRTMNT
jgi:GMP synthase-like glutamine amidotransferase